MKIALAGCLIVTLAALGAATVIAAPTENPCYDPSAAYGAGLKVFYEGWGYAEPAGDYSLGGAPYKAGDYGRGWTSIGPNPLGWIVSGKNGQAAFAPKPPQLDSTEACRENNDYTNSGEYAGSSTLTGGSFPYAGTARASGVYVDGPQLHHLQSIWVDVNGNGEDVGDGVSRLQFLLKHDIPELPDGKKVRADVQYYWTKNYWTNLGYGIRVYFETNSGGTGHIDFAPHIYVEPDPKTSKFAWRIVGIPEHPEWEQWTETFMPMGAGNYAAPEDRVHWRHVGIDFGLITPGEVTLVTREATYTEQENRFVHLTGINLFDYIKGAKALAIGQVDEAPVGTTSASQKMWIDNVWVSTSLPPATSIDEIKKTGAGAPVALSSALVSAQFHDDTVAPFSFAVQTADRSSGVRVLWPSEAMPGDDVAITGKVAVVDGECIVQADGVQTSASGSAPNPLAMNGLASGGGDFGLQKAVANSVPASAKAAGLSNVGLLVKLTGKVTYALYDGTFSNAGFYIDDGAGLDDGSGNAGIRCRPPSLFGIPGTLPDVGRQVVVTGVMGVKQAGGMNTRYLWTTAWEYAD